MLLVFSPILTRLYDPVDFGALAVFSSLTAIIGGIVTLRYEFAVPIATTAEHAAAAVAVAALSCFSMVGLTTIGVMNWGGSLAAWVQMPVLDDVLGLLPLALLMSGLSQPLDYWSIRNNSVRLNAASRLVLFGSQGLVQAVLGLLWPTALGLVVGYVVGYTSRFLVLLGGVRRADWQRLARLDRTTIIGVARRGWHYPTFATGSTFLQGLNNFVPAILVAAMYDAATAGMFGLAQRVLVVPIRLVSAAASQVFLDEAARLDHQALRRLRNVTVTSFLVLGLVVMGPVLLAGPWLFAVGFGEAWREAGTMAQLLVVPQLARFVLMPVSQTFNVLGRMDLDLVTVVIGTGLLAVAFGFGATLGWSPLATIAAYAFATTVGQLLTLIVAWWLTQNNRAAARRPDASG